MKIVASSGVPKQITSSKEWPIGRAAKALSSLNLTGVRLARLGLLAGPLLGAAALAQQPVQLPALSPSPYRPQLSDFRIAASEVIPATESAQNVVLSDSVSEVPEQEAVNRIVAPPLTVVLKQQLGIRDVQTGQVYLNGQPRNGFERKGDTQATWEPGQWTVSMQGQVLSLAVQHVVLNQPQGVIEKITITNESAVTRSVQVFSVQAPSISTPKEWDYSNKFVAGDPASSSVSGAVLVHSNENGALSLGAKGAVWLRFASAETALAALLRGDAITSATGEKADASAAIWSLNLAPKAKTTVYLELTTATSAASAKASAEKLIARPEAAAEQARAEMQTELAGWFKNLPAVSASPEVTRFYQHAAVQLLYDRWKVGKTFLLDPWYPTSGRDSGAMNLYCWDVQYAALTFSLLDPASLRSILKLLPAAPLTEHYAVDPVHAHGQGPFYAFNSYAYTDSVARYLAMTGDESLLRESVAGKTVLDWLIALAEQGDQSRDPDGNNLLDYGDDKNLLELHKTGKGPGYQNEVPSPNGERVFVYRTVADLMERVDSARYHDTILHFREMADRVAKALNSILWMDKEGWYGTRQRDGAVVPVYTVQIYELLRFPGLVPQERARRMAAHLNDDEFVAPWGIRSMSKTDRLFDYNDHDWGGPISYIGTGPDLSADLFAAGLPEAGWLSLRKILWWPDHLSVYPQGIGNDSYTFRYPEAAKFGGRVAGGHSNIVAAASGVNAILRGIFGFEAGLDGSVRFANNQIEQQEAAVSMPFHGRVWTATQSPEGLDLRTSDGFAASFFRPDGAVQVKLAKDRIAIDLDSRAAGAGRLTLDTANLTRTLGASSQSQLVFRRNGTTVQPAFAGGRAVLPTQTGPGATEKITIERQP